MDENITRTCGCCCEGFSQVAGLRTAREGLSRQTLEQLGASQELYARFCHELQRGESMFALSLRDRISEVECWRTALGQVSRRLHEQTRLLAEEGDTLRVVLGRLEEELRQHCGEGRPPGDPSARRGDVEVELAKELKLLKTERTKFTKKIAQVERSLARFTNTKRSIDRDVQMKSHAVRVDRELTSLDADCVAVSRKHKPQPYERWVEQCRALQATGAAAAQEAAALREECREMRARLSCSVRAQAARADAALRARVHRTRNQLHDLLWQMQELELDAESAGDEQLEAERRMHECLVQQRAAAARLAARASKADEELCDDQVQAQLRQQIRLLKGSEAELGEDIQRIRRLKNALTAARTEVESCAHDRQRALEADLAVERRRGAACELPAAVASSSDAAAGASGFTLLDPPSGALPPIQECDE